MTDRAAAGGHRQRQREISDSFERRVTTVKSALIALTIAAITLQGRANYTTVFHASLNVESGHLLYASGGHLPGQAVRRAVDTYSKGDEGFDDATLIVVKAPSN